MAHSLRERTQWGIKGSKSEQTLNTLALGRGDRQDSSLKRVCSSCEDASARCCSSGGQMLPSLHPFARHQAALPIAGFYTFLCSSVSSLISATPFTPSLSSLCRRWCSGWWPHCEAFPFALQSHGGGWGHSLNTADLPQMEPPPLTTQPMPALLGGLP